MEARINGQGHHHKVRQPFPNLKKEVHRIKVVRKTPLKAWQLAMMRLGISFDGLLKPFYSVVNDMAQEEMICVGIGFGNAEAWYVDSDGYCMLQANDAEPPPKNGILRKALQCAAVFFLSLMVLIGPTSCQKDPEPTPGPAPAPTPADTITPITPIDTITPVVPGDTLEPVIPGDTLEPVVPGDTIAPVVPPMPGDTIPIPGRKVVFAIIKPGNQGIRYPTKDTIQFYANHPGCDTILFKWVVPPNVTSGWTPSSFRSPRDSLKVRFAMSPKIFGSGRICVNKNYGGASIPCEDSLNISKLGMTACDSAAFAGWGYEPFRDPGTKSRDEHAKFINNVGMKWAILGKQR